MATLEASNFAQQGYSIDGRDELETGKPNPNRAKDVRTNTTGNKSSNGKIRKNSLRNSKRNGTQSGNHGNHRNGHVIRSTTNRNIDARRRKEKIRRRKRKHNKCTLIQRLIDQLERQPEVESRALLRITCRDVSYFVVLFSAVLFLRSAVSQYTIGMLDQLQVGYLFSLNHLDLIKGTELIGFVSTMILVALFGRRSHRPLLVACGVLVLALGTIIWPVPYYVSSTGSTQSGYNVSYGCDASRIAQTLSTANVPAMVYGQLCKTSKSGNTTGNIQLCSSCPKDGDWLGKRDGYLYIVGFAGFLMGFGTGLFLTSGTLYIEEASRPTDVPLKYGFLFFMSGLGEFLGSCFAWWFSNYPENLKGSVPQPWSVRAWWLGMVIFACFLFASSFTFLFFPKWIIEPTWSIVERQARLARLAKLLAAAKRDRQKRREQTKKDKKRQKQKDRQDDVTVPDEPPPSDKSSHPDPSASNDPEPAAAYSSESDGEGDGVENGVRVTSNPPVTKAPHKVNKGVSFGDVTIDNDEDLDVTSSSAANGSGIGVAVATVSTTRRSRTNRTQDKVSQILSECFSAVWRLISNPAYLVAIVSVTLAAYLPAGYRRVMASFVRSQYLYDGFSSYFYSDGLGYSLADAIGSFAGGFVVWKLQLSIPRQVRLIIVVLGVNIFFFFLLFAVGCGKSEPTSYPRATGFSSDLCSGDCDCSGVQLDDVCSPDGTRFPSPCAAGCSGLTTRNSSLVYSSCRCVSTGANSEVSAAFCSTCSTFGGYWILLFLAIIAHSFSYVSVVLYFLRVVKEDERLLSLSFAVWIVALGAYVPGTAVFRGIESSSCKAWQDDCFDESICWSRDVNKNRYDIHGANIAFQSAAILGFILVLYLLGELNPCQRLDSRSSLEEFDLGEGQGHLRRRSIIPAVSTDNVLLGDAADADSEGNPDILSRFRESDGVSYRSPVFESEMLDSYTEPSSISFQMKDDLEMSRSRDFVVDVDRLSGESSL